ncbi:G-type lectin S-receptor-like serine/threonine-protein kinase LECRK2 [Rhododendron vialii]|uniref:G-type lectin S-receptor-like serine/threonine-protein kinase LECRK2 n=1 Tax=Rhododendron vialii TaxID=182163 RepID=UPI00265E87FF|nr:G-type lectin S-receptor-like serine/threonine-protein kinase LECRK2 [Rhododendron vialii]
MLFLNSKYHKIILNQQNSLFIFMAFAIIFLIFLTFSTIEAQQTSTNISLSSSLTPTGTNSSSWLSRSGLYAFGFYRQGSGYAVGVFAAGVPEKTVVWTADRDDLPIPSNATLAFRGGRLVLNIQPHKNTTIADVESISGASILDSGNFVLYNSTGGIIWQSFDYPTDTILPGQRLMNGNKLISSVSKGDHSTGIFRLEMQGDGHLVSYPLEYYGVQYAYWASGTWGTGNNITLNLDDNGHLYLLDETGGNNIKNLSTAESSNDGKIYRMTFDADGIFRVYSLTLDPKGNWSVMWSSSDDKCDPKGLCGINGYCVRNDTEADCRCLPGFDFVNSEIWSLGCERNFAAVSCDTNGGSAEIVMEEMPNMIIEDQNYEETEVTNKEDCKQSCFEDCNCEVALYSDDNKCKKQRLPLTYGRTSLGTSQVAFIKVTKEHRPPLPPKRPKKELRLETVLIIGASLVTFAILVLTFSGFLIYRKRVWVYKKISEKGYIEFAGDIVLRTFTFAELEHLTNGFREELGRGASGTVYKGIIPYNQKVVAVKKLEKALAEGERHFQREIKVIGRTHHRNLVQLIGYCLDGPNRLLVYEYMCNGSLADFLFTHERPQPNWEEKVEIARNIACGIHYLHDDCETQIIHCDIKPQNILMDEHCCAKISDFGLAKLSKAPDQTKTFTGIRGTRGYVAPEWHRRLPITVKADVYSFGVVLLEIICGRKCLDWSRREDEAVLEDRVYDCYEAKELGKLVGEEEEVDMRKLERMVKVGLWCIQDEPSLRPSMKKVLLMIEGTVDIPTPPSPTSFLSAI